MLYILSSPPFSEQGYVQNLFALFSLFDAFLDNRL